MKYKLITVIFFLLSALLPTPLVNVKKLDPIVVEPPSYVLLRANFHTHTTISDGEYSPAETVKIFKDAGFDVVAITDHSSLEGVPEATAMGETLGIIVVPGEEITSKWSDGTKKHILALFTETSIEDKYRRTEEVAWYFDQIHKQGGVGIVAHPLEWNPPTWGFWKNFTTNYYCRYYIDGWEFMAGNDPTAVEYNRWLFESDQLYLMNRDFHYISKGLYNQWTILMSHNNTIEGVKEALLSKRVVIHVYGTYLGSPENLALYVLLTDTVAIKYSSTYPPGCRGLKIP